MSVKAFSHLALALASCALQHCPCPTSQPTRAAGIGGAMPAARAGPTYPPARIYGKHLLCRHLISGDPDHVGRTKPYSDRHCAAKAAPSVANIRTLGFDPKDVSSCSPVMSISTMSALRRSRRRPARLIARAEARFQGLRPARWAARIRNMTSLCR